MLTNLGMIFIPILLFFVVEIILGYIIFVIFQGTPSGDQLNLFITVRFISIILILILTNGLLTYFMSKSILTPIEKLSTAAKKISEGNLDFNIHSNKSDELGNLINTFEMMRAELKKSKKAQLQYEKNRQQLIASISHDLRTPLTSIKGYIMGLKDGVANTPEKLNRYMDIIYQTANDMDQLIDELFLYSKLELDKVPFHYEKVDLYAFFADFIEELNLQLENENGTAKLLANKSDDLIAYADREKLKRVVMNIVQNSRKYFDKENNEIAVILTTNSNEVTVEIKDNGSGIQKEEIPYIFDRFYRTDSSRNTSTGGSGLGLSIVKKIIEAHGGTVWADSEIGQGTSIYFTLKKGDEDEKSADY